MHFFQSFWKSISWFIMIATLSLISANRLPNIESKIIEIDKVVHFILYFVWITLLIKSFQNFRNTNQLFKIVFIPIILCALTGATIEFLQQTYTQTRHGDWHDFVANCIGISFGILLYPVVNKYLGKIL